MHKYSKEDICKPKRISNTAIYGNLPQSTAIYRNLRQSPAISGNLPVPITLPSTAIVYTVTARKEGRKSAYIDIQTA